MNVIPYTADAKDIEPLHWMSGGQYHDRCATALDACLRAMDCVLRRETIMGQHERVATILFIAHTFVFESFRLTPRLFLTSIKPGHGKSTVLRQIAGMSWNGEVVTRATTAALGRLKRRYGPSTVCLDQLDHALHRHNGDLIDTLCAGAERGAKSIMVEKSSDGAQGVEQFDYFYPVALAKIGAIPDPALLDRCIVIRMHPATTEESDLIYRQSRDTPEPEILEITANVMSALTDLSTMRPALPPGIANRMRMKWVPLVAIADLARGPWPELARQAAVALEIGSDQKAPRSLEALKCAAFVVKGWPHSAIFTTELIDEMERRGFHVAGGDGLTPKWLSRALGEVGCGPDKEPIRQPRDRQRGYRIKPILDAAERYHVFEEDNEQ